MARIADPQFRLLGDLQLPDRYELRRRIAKGGMASVWCAHDRELGRDVAIKLLAEQFAHDPAAIRRFKREARAAARLSGHPHVVTIFDVGEAIDPADSGRRGLLVMEYLAGGTVADALRVGEVSRDDALRWLHEAASALDYAHGRGVVHRDIKPANFLLDRARVLRVADFGIARLASEETITGTGYMLGTAAYLSPERALGHPATEASDRYALAVVAFELLTSERPFTAEHFAAQARLHVEEPVPRASGRDPSIPRAVDAVLARGMSKRPEDRWPTSAAFVDTLDLALTERAGRRIRRGTAASAAAAARLRGRPRRGSHARGHSPDARAGRTDRITAPAAVHPRPPGAPPAPPWAGDRRPGRGCLRGRRSPRARTTAPRTHGSRPAPTRPPSRGQRTRPPTARPTIGPPTRPRLRPRRRPAPRPPRPRPRRRPGRSRHRATS